MPQKGNLKQWFCRQSLQQFLEVILLIPDVVDNHYSGLLYEPHNEKTCLRGFRPGKTQTGLLSYRD